MQTMIASTDATLGGAIRQEMLKNGQDSAACQVLRFESVIQQISEFKPELIVLVLPPDLVQGQTMLVELRRLVAIPILVLGPATDPKFILQILRAGATEYLDAADCLGEIQGAWQRLQAQRTKREATGKVVTVAAACGGGGASTVAVNLAVALAADCKKSLLVDLILETGALAALLDIRPTYTLTDLCQANGLIDRTMVERSLARHKSGVELLASPRMQDRFLTHLHRPDASATPAITADSLRQTLALSRFMFPYIVIDHSPNFSEEQLQALRMADVMLFVFRLEFAALRNVQRLMEHIDRLGLPRNKVRLIANRSGQAKEVPLEKAVDALKTPVFHLIPDDVATTNRANNFGVPAVLDAPRSKVAQSYCELARKIRGV